MSPAVSTALAVVALVLAVVAIVLATVANRRWVRRPSRSAALTGAAAADDGRDDLAGADPDGGPVLVAERDPDAASRELLAGNLAEVRDQVAGLSAHVEDLAAQSATVRQDVDALRNQLEEVAARVDDRGDPTALRHVAVVRYDAFADVGGRLSYSVALLDDTSSGLVLTTLAGKADVRTYVRTISAGSGDGSLTAEEQQAIDAAVGSRQ
jgi:outer membrane murein-binding lipoprotein Lpp